jgi:hypothetical protein
VRKLGILLAALLTVGACGGGGSYDKVLGSIRIDRDCDDLGGFQNILFMDIVIRDSEEKLIDVMDPNPLNGVLGGGLPWCTAVFSAKDLPKKDMYIIDAGTRGTFYVSEDEITIDEDGDASLFSLSID